MRPEVKFHCTTRNTPGIMTEESSSSDMAKSVEATARNIDEFLPPNCKEILELSYEETSTTKIKYQKPQDENTQSANVQSHAKSIAKSQVPGKKNEKPKDTNKKAHSDVQHKKCLNSQKQQKNEVVHKGQQPEDKSGQPPKQEKKKIQNKEKSGYKQREADQYKNDKVVVKESQVGTQICKTPITHTDEIVKKEASVNKQKKQTVVKEQHKFPDYLPVATIEKLLLYSAEGDSEYVEGYLRINQKFSKHAYLPMPDQQADLLIIGLRNRNRAFDGDLVVARVNRPEEWTKLPEGTEQKTGVIVYIREKVHPRKAVGYLKQRKSDILFYPRDQRIPLFRIYPESLPASYSTQPELYKDVLFLASIVNWKKLPFAIGSIDATVGEAGDIEAESNAILHENHLDVAEYSPEITKDLPPADYVPTEVDTEGREDWRNECVFTIDPATAVDLDDAVSCKPLTNGNYEVAVHISDVTHYLKFLSPLDIEVSKRTTTVYMVDNVYHMLPKQLCQVCSLLPGQDKLAFSVIWEMTPNAEVVKRRFAKTIIRSCCQMSYQHAQAFIENVQTEWSDDFVDIKGNFTPRHLYDTVNILHKLAVQMRNKRFANGALQLDLPKLHVTIDRITGLPTSYNVEERKDSNRLIEEFMLLANMTVALHLFETMPDTALLRQHKEPSQYTLKTIRDTLQKFGIHLDIENVGALQASIRRYEEQTDLESEEARFILKYRMMVINNLCSKAMNRALYKCAANVLSQDELWHYALNVPLYTHFTSPIRRYIDCVVHRLLYSTLEDVPLPKEWSAKLCAKIAADCNVKKYRAKLAQEQSTELYFTYLTSLNGPFVTIAIVLDVKEHSIDVILCHIGLKLRIYLNHLEKMATVQYSTESAVPTLTLTWENSKATQVINIFAVLCVRVMKHPEQLRLDGILLPP